MKFSLNGLLQGFDSFGHKIDVNYNGQSSYKTLLGGILTIGMYILTSILVFNSVSEIFTMQDPTLTEYNRPFSTNEKADLMPLRFEDYDFSLAIVMAHQHRITK